MEDTAELYRRFARVEACGESSTYERLALAVARDESVLALLAAVEPRCRQPNLLFGALRLLGASLDDPSRALGWLRAHAESVLEVLRTRRTQTNEVGRCAIHLPVLAALPQPLALIEVGASAGLCLLPDRWRYRYTGPGVARTVGAGAVTVACTVDGPVPLPTVPPVIAWRAGLDLHPVDAADPDARRWLRCLVWPEHRDRAARLESALRVAAAAAPRIERGHLVDDLPTLLRQTPAGATSVVLHSATLTYVDPAERLAFRAVVAHHGAHRVGCEGVDVLPDLAAQLPPSVDVTGMMVISLDDRALGVAHPHGRTLTWLHP